MEILKRRVSFVAGLSVGEKIGLVFVVTCLNENIERSYLKLCQEQEESRSLEVSCDNTNCRKQSSGSGHGKTQLFTTLRQRFKAYTSITNYILTVNFFKYLLVALIVETKLGPPDWNCYLPGRLFLHELSADINLAIGISLVALLLIWQYIATRSENNYELLNMLLFLLSDNQVIGRERVRVEAINKKNRLIQANGGLVVDELENILQKALFYKLTTSHGLIVYKLRPNRTRHYKRQLAIYVDRFYLIFISLGISYVMLLIPITIQCWYSDNPYGRTYPSCCRASSHEQQARPSQGGRANCSQRLYTLAFDVVDSSIILLGAGLIHLAAFLLSTIITGSLVLHWKVIDSRIRHLTRRYKLQRLETKRPKVCRLPTTWRIKFVAHEMDRKCLMEYEKDDLQQLIIDFFKSFKKINRLAGSLIGYTFLLFFNSVLTFAYSSFRIPNYFETVASRFFVFGVYSMFFMNSLMVLQLNRVLNKSYPNICSLMAADGTTKAVNWIPIMDIFADRLDTSYSLLGWRLNWHLIASMAASSLSFLFLVEAYKKRHSDSMGA